VTAIFSGAKSGVRHLLGGYLPREVVLRRCGVVDRAVGLCVLIFHLLPSLDLAHNLARNVRRASACGNPRVHRHRQTLTTNHDASAGITFNRLLMSADRFRRQGRCGGCRPDRPRES
jgi:hypothetical protein